MIHAISKSQQSVACLSLFFPAYVCKVLYLFNGPQGPVAHVAHYCRGGHTVLGEAADPNELFAIFDCEDVHLSEVVRKVNVTYWPGKRILCVEIFELINFRSKNLFSGTFKPKGHIVG